MLDLLDVSKFQPHIKTLTETLKSNRLVEALDAGTRQRIVDTANRLQPGLNKQFGKFSGEVRGWLKKQPNNSAEADYVSKKVPKKAEKPNAKGGTASEAKEHSSIGHTGRESIFHAAVSELTQSRLFFKGVLGEHMADYWVIEQGWAAGWQTHDWGMDGKWPSPDPKAPRKLNDRGAMTPLLPLVLRGRGIDALWRTNGKNGKSYAVIEAKAYTNPATPLSTMLEDRHDKQEYGDYKEKLREWKGKRRGGRGRSGKRSSKVAQQPHQPASLPPPQKPEPKTMQMSHTWIQDRISNATNDLVARSELLIPAGNQARYSRHVLLFSVPAVYDHTIALAKWIRHQANGGQPPQDSEHDCHNATRIFGDAELAAEERRRAKARASKGGVKQ
ncbi:hypothetical protein [Cupriavidus necator]|uniref:hypothetical protein n=1 Tax=Cupriavidus necator TaxID=106590 RepID=UPI00339D94C5